MTDDRQREARGGGPTVPSARSDLGLGPARDNGVRRSRGTRWARWGMSLTTLGMGAALVVTGLTTYGYHREAAAAVAEGRAQDLFRGIRRSLRELRDASTSRESYAGPSDAAREDFRGLADELAEAGLRYAAVVAPWGEVLLSSGTPTGGEPRALGPDRPADRSIFPGELELKRVGGRLRLEGPLGTPRRGGRPGRGGPGGRLVLEVEPVLAQAIEASAEGQLVVSLVVATGLLGMALLFWRLAARADRFEAALARQRQLAALGEMSAVLGHELRNPLASLKGHAQLALEKTDATASARKNVERVVAEAERLEVLSARILDFARTGTVSRGAVSPRALVDAAVQRLGAEAGAIAIVEDKVPPSWPLDRDRMEQVLVNVLKNARQASPEGAAIEVGIETRGGRLVISVRDRGAGIPPGEEEAIFEPFRTHRVQGTGLGLAIARRIVEAHGGTITATNAAGGGAQVTIELGA